MLSDVQIASMTPDERIRLSRRLAAANADALVVLDSVAAGRRRRRIVDLLVVVCIGLIPWIVLLGVTLPHRYVAHHWTAAWVGFDIALLANLAATAWAGWRRRQVAILFAIVTATMLLIDAWFDILTDATTRDLIVSVVTAVIGELPLAALLFVTAFRLVRVTTRTARLLAGDTEDLPLRKVPLFAIDPLVPEQPGDPPRT